MKRNGIKHIKSTPYHPSTNGLAERFVQTFKRAMLKDFGSRPTHHQLANFLLVYRSSPHSTTNRTPSELFLKDSFVQEWTCSDLIVKFRQGWGRDKDPRSWSMIVIRRRESIELERLLWQETTEMVQSGWKE